MLPRPNNVRLTLLATLLVLGVTSACNDVTLVPSAPGSLAAPTSHSGDVIPTTLVARGTIVRRTQPLASDERECVDLTPKFVGGSLSVSLQNSGLKVTFYDGAVTAKTTVCLVAHSGALLTYSFYPHGLKFNNQVKVQQDLRGTTAYLNSAVMAGLVGGYMANGVENDIDTIGVGSFAQIFGVSDYTGTLLKITSKQVKFSTNHFSGYALASGLSDDVSSGY